VFQDVVLMKNNVQCLMLDSRRLIEGNEIRKVKTINCLWMYNFLGRKIIVIQSSGYTWLDSVNDFLFFRRSFYVTYYILYNEDM